MVRDALRIEAPWRDDLGVPPEGTPPPGRALVPVAPPAPGDLDERIARLLTRIVAAAGFLPLVVLFRTYPRLGAAVVAPVASLATAAYFASDFMALLLGAYCLGLGLIFANWAADDIVRDTGASRKPTKLEDLR